KVQILDPATGTGTFLAEVIKHVHKKFKGQEGIWSSYVENDLLPRLNGFELLMASYAMAHLQIDLLLKQTGYKNSPPTGGVSEGRGGQRTRIYLTNSLEEFHPDTGTLFANWLSTEANEANHIKRDTPIMCIIGNPPYAVSSSNKSPWIESLIADYKKDLKEKSYNSLSDDYVKFIRYGQYFIQKNGEGVLAYISNNSFIDGVVFRQMRKNLLETFDKIYILDLHGNSKKQEVCPDGSPDQNVFDIMQGVSINIFVKTGRKNKNDLCELFQYDLQGKRDYKYNKLLENSLKSIQWKKLEVNSPDYAFCHTDYELRDKYEVGFSLSELFKINNVGFTAARDSSLIHLEKRKVLDLLNNLESAEIEEIRAIHSFGPDSRDWTIKGAIEDIKSKKDRNITQVNYRPFDFRYTHYSNKTKGFFSYPRWEIMQHFYNKENIGLIATRLNRQKSLGYFWVSNTMIERHILDTAGDSTSFFALYVYPINNGQQSFEGNSVRTPNLNAEIVKQIADKLGLTFTNEKTSPTPPKEGLSQPGYITANPKNYPLIKEMRDILKDEPTKAEKVIWEYFRNKKTGHKIRRQHIIDNFITDFVCLSSNVVIEIDGKIHLQQKEQDALRTEKLNNLGYEVIRFTNEEVFKNPELVMLKVKEKLDSKNKILIYEDTVSPPSEGQGEVFAPIDILDYIYAVLHSPTYREKYKEFLKIDFPRVPYPKDTNTFWKLVKLGGEIRQIHLLESPIVEDYITQYPINGDNVVGKPHFVNSPPLEGCPQGGVVGKVYINYDKTTHSENGELQYFSNVPLAAWEFYIGGYQPAQKWLKDRKGRTLNFEDILHYQKIIVALSETNRLMKEIDKIDME
ncbi:MAG: type ISP restriction/modification enzyme, partial [Lutibacter sp.]